MEQCNCNNNQIKSQVRIKKTSSDNKYKSSFCIIIRNNNNNIDGPTSSFNCSFSVKMVLLYCFMINEMFCGFCLFTLYFIIQAFLEKNTKSRYKFECMMKIFYSLLGNVSCWIFFFLDGFVHRHFVCAAVYYMINVIYNMVLCFFSVF